MPTYTITIDAAEDGAFSEAVTARVLAARWRLGCTATGQPLAPPGEAILMLDNADGALDDDLLAGWSGRWLRIRALAGVEETMLFTGVVTHIEPDAGARGRRQARLTAVTPDAALATLRADLPPLPSLRADELIHALLVRADLRRPALALCLVLGSADFGVIGFARIADDLPMPLDAQPGVSHVAYAIFDPDARAADALERIAESERGLCFAARSGGLSFLNRHDALLPDTPLLTLTDSMTALDLAHGQAVNQVSIACQPRRIGPDDTPLWTLNTPLRLPPRADITVRVAFRDDEGHAVGCVGAPVLSFTARSGPSGGPAAAVAGRIIDALASGARLRFTNLTASPAWVQARAQVRGAPVFSDGRLTVTHEDQPAITRHGAVARLLDLPLVSDADEALDLARFEVAHGVDPLLLAGAVTVDIRDHPAAPGITIGDRLALSDAHTGHAGTYRVLGEAHEIDLAGTRHRVTFLLAAAGETPFWIVGSGALDARTALAV